MLSKILSCSVLGIEGNIVEVEVDVMDGFPCFSIVGLADAVIVESRDRIRSALKNNDFEFPPKRNVVNLSPADLKKEGAWFDLPICLGILLSLKIIKKFNYKDFIILGELSLKGEVRKSNNVINGIILAKQKNIKNIIIPYGNYQEASLIDSVNIVLVKNLKDVVNYFNKNIELKKPPKEIPLISNEEYMYDFKEVKGQKKAKRALLIAASGGHNTFMLGSPGSGKTLLAKTFMSILPGMHEKEIIECTQIYSSVGMLGDNNLINDRPFRMPHHTASDIALIGGGRNAKAGEITLAHNGVLFLDELPEFNRNVLESLREPLEEKIINITRANYSVKLPANFILLAAGNPCPCGFLYEENSSSKICTCSANQISNYQKKISGPFLDRVDIFLDMKRVKTDEIFDEKNDAPSSNDLIKIVKKTQKIQHERYKKIKLNTDMNNLEIKKYCKLDNDTKTILKMAIDNLDLSVRGTHKILKLARTIADIDDKNEIDKKHILEAISYRKK